jgi:hypothetical protein
MDPSTYGRMVTHGPASGAVYVGETGPEPTVLDTALLNEKLTRILLRLACQPGQLRLDRGPDDPPSAALVPV